MKRSLFMAGLIALCLLAWRWDSRVFFGAYLAAWWFWIGIAMGGLANVWLHNLTGGKWGEAVRIPLLGLGARVWIAALLFLPVLLGMRTLYPWVAGAAQGAGRWSGELSAPDFKDLWLTPAFFIGRMICCMVLWVLLARLTLHPALQRSKGFSAAALVLYGFSVSIVAIDCIMSLMPLWYSSVFGWLAGTGQMLSGMALATLLVSGAENESAKEPLSRDLGNLLLMYVMMWAYLAFVQFLVIWAEDKPHEIAWFVARADGWWLAMAWGLAALLFFMPLLLLLFRRVKDAPRAMGRLAAVILAMQLVECWWQVLPSIPVPPLRWLAAAPLVALAVGVFLAATLRHIPGQEAAHHG
jgi:hypothetical protein